MQNYGFVSVTVAVFLVAVVVAVSARAEPSVIPVYGGKKAMVAITYDDGLVSHYDVARPMHAKYKVGGTFFVPVTCADNPKKRNRHGDRCDWKMLLEMQAEGLEVASHTMTHANLRKLRDARAYEQVTNEIVGAKAIFASHGIDVKTVAFGFNAKYDGAVALCRASGQYPRLYQFGTGSKDTPERYDELLKTKWSKENEYSIPDAGDLRAPDPDPGGIPRRLRGGHEDLQHLPRARGAHAPQARRGRPLRRRVRGSGDALRPGPGLGEAERRLGRQDRDRREIRRPVIRRRRRRIQ